MPIRAFLMLALICFLWALNVVVTRLVVSDMGVPPVWYAGLRSLVVVAALLPWLRPVPPRIIWTMVVTFMVSGGAFALFFIGMQDATPSSSAVVSLSGAPLTVLLAILILGEKVRWRRGIGIALAFAGVGVAVASPSAWDSSFGLVLVFLSALVGALGSVFLKQIDLAPARLQAWAGLGSAFILIPLSLVTESGQVGSTLAGGWYFLAGLLFSALAVSVFAHTLYFDILQRYDANLVAPLSLMTPMFTIALGVAITGDEVGPTLLIGAGLAAAGVLVILVRPSRQIFKPLLVRARL